MERESAQGPPAGATPPSRTLHINPKRASPKASRILAGLSHLCLALALWLSAGSSLSAQALFPGSEPDPSPWRLRIEGCSLSGQLVEGGVDSRQYALLVRGENGRCRAEQEQEELPHVYLRLEAWSSGLAWPVNRQELSPLSNHPWPYRAGYVGLEMGRIRAGLALAGGVHPFVSFLPISVAVTLWDRPTRYVGRLYGKLPEVYVEAQGGFANIWDPHTSPNVDFAGTFSLVASGDCFGVGASAMAGLGYVRASGAGNGVYPGDEHSEFCVFAGVRYHLAVVRVGIEDRGW